MSIYTVRKKEHFCNRTHITRARAHIIIVMINCVPAFWLHVIPLISDTTSHLGNICQEPSYCHSWALVPQGGVPSEAVTLSFTSVHFIYLRPVMLI